MQSSLKILAVMLPIAVASTLPAACRSEVVVDGRGGSGGMGSSMSTTGTFDFTVTSTSSGAPACSCDQFCSIMLDCGHSTKDCVDFACAQVPVDTQQCVCHVAPLLQCNFLDTCFDSGTGGSGGGGIADACIVCGTDLLLSACPWALPDCQSNPDCQSIIDCSATCNFTNECLDKCLAQSAGDGPFYFQSLVQCGFCVGPCWQLCQDSAIIDLCHFGPA